MQCYSLLQAKSFDSERRTIEGWATTPTPDRVDDVVEPSGVVYRGPVNLHLYHDHNLPVGNVEFGQPTPKGIPFTATIPDVAEEGTVKSRVDEAWHSIKYKLLAAVSIGFRALPGGVEMLGSGGIRYTKWEMLELSLVSVPAQPEALIESFKSMDVTRIKQAMGDPVMLNLKAGKGAVMLVRPETRQRARW